MDVASGVENFQRPEGKTGTWTAGWEELFKEEYKRRNLTSGDRMGRNTRGETNGTRKR